MDGSPSSGSRSLEATRSSFDPATLRHVRGELGRSSWTSAGTRIARALSEHAVGVHASAIAFRVLFALVPLALFAIALLGFLDLEDVWTRSIAPEVRSHTSAAGFTVLDTTVEHVLGRKEGFWMTAGAALALWEVSAAIRIAMRALDRIYDERRPRSPTARTGVSLALALPVVACLLGALAAAQLLPFTIGRTHPDPAVDLAVRVFGWGVAAVLLALVVALLVRFGPSSPQPFRPVGAASVLVVVAWAATSAVFGYYATHIASYGSVFGGLAFAIILFTYLYLSSIVFLVGIELDAFLAMRPAAGRA